MNAIRTTSLAAFALASVFALSAEGAGTGNAPLGSNLAGEACETRGPISQSASTVIACAGADAATLRIGSLGASLPAAGEAHHEAIVRAALAMRSDEAGPLTCDAGQWFDAMNRGLLVCIQQSNGWPRLVDVSVAGNLLYEADGMPSSLPGLQGAVARA